MMEQQMQDDQKATETFPSKQAKEDHISPESDNYCHHKQFVEFNIHQCEIIWRFTR